MNTNMGRKGKRGPTSPAASILPRIKGKKRDSIASSSPNNLAKWRPEKAAPSFARSTPRPSAHGPDGRDRKRHLKLGEVARRRARDDKFGFGGDRFGSATPTQSRISNPTTIDSDSTSSYGDDESEREMTQSMADADETEDESMGSLHEAFAGHEIEDLAYGAGHPGTSIEDSAEMEWWNDNETDNGDVNDEEDDEDFIANLTGSDIDQLQSQSSVHASSDDPMSDSSSDTDDACDEFGFPTRVNHTAGEEPLVLMENWDGQYVLVQPRQSRRRERGTGSRTAGSIGESTSVSAGEQHLIIDEDANDDSDSSADWAGVEDDDGGDTTDSMAEEDMPVLDSPALDQIIGQQIISPPQYNLAMLPHPNPFFEAMGTASIEAALEAVAANPSIVITDATATSSSGSSPSTAAAPTPGITPVLTSGISGAIVAQLLPMTPVTSPTSGTPSGILPVGPVMGTFSVCNEHCESAIIDGSKTTTKSPFTRRRRNRSSDSGSTSAKRRPKVGDPFSPAVKKTRYSSIPGHPRYIAARRAAQTLMDPLERETTPSEEEMAFSLDDMLNIPGNDMDSTVEEPQSPELRHLFRFDKIPVSTYMRRNFSSGSRNRTVPVTPSQGSFSLTSSASRSPTVNGVGLSGTLAGPLPYPASRMLISPVLPPSEGHPIPLSRKERRRARKGASTDIHPFRI
ncbi:hypothetical protein CspeluHIS016_0309840 [Cutaneotrichosporon spelunceum]|uniref:Uncharacterized protein n=1 Tax=Cutaneotrichosporon spelunceum TaxID=1672016 RepID=A0AAD3YCR7_9TREE|nr:hypothetical protein CspeluHIS016_0309840 [Cutaneotrichosporon spelunceum]